jgi:hypothetical protein
MTDPAIFQVLIRQLKQVSVKPEPGNPWSLHDGEWIDQLCNVFVYLSPESAIAVAGLNELAERIGTNDRSIRQRVIQVADVIKR